MKRTKVKKGKIKLTYLVAKIIFSILSKKKGFNIKEKIKNISEKSNIGIKAEVKIWKLLALLSIFAILIIGSPNECSAIKAKLKSKASKAHKPKISAPKVFREK